MSTRPLFSLLAFTVFAANASAGTVGPFQLDNGISGPRRFEVIVPSGGGTSFAAVYPAPQVTPNFDLVSDFTPFMQLGAIGGARELALSGNNLVTFIAQTGTVRSNGSFTGPNGTITWVSEARLPAGSQRYENTTTFTSASAFGAVRYISFMDASMVDRVAALNAGTPDFNFVYFNNDQSTSTTGIAHGIAQNRLVNASYAGWVMRRASNLFSNITDPARETFSLAGVIDPSIITTSDPRLPGVTAYRIFNDASEPATAFAVDLNANATTATIVTYLTAYPVVQLDPIFKNGFE
jgi:hypothetical protein